MDKKIIQELKNEGFMQQKQDGKFSLRIRVAGGQVPATQMKKIIEIAEKYGEGYVHLTSRQSVEIPFIEFNDIDSIKEELASAGVQPASCGARLRTVTACHGKAVCRSGLIETSGLAKELDERYLGVDLPHKFKIGITGCKNNCLKAEENDLGIKGGMLPEWESSPCTYCGICGAICPGKAITVDKKEKTLAFDQQKCLHCGKCVKLCPTNAWTGVSGYLVSFGGLFGNTLVFGEKLLPILTSKQELLVVTDTTINFFQKHAKRGERFRKTLDRTGIDELKRELKIALKQNQSLM